GHPWPEAVQFAGTGPIVVPTTVAAPSSGTVPPDRFKWIVSPAVAWVRPAQVRLNPNAQGTVSPGPAWPRSRKDWFPGATASPSAGTVSAKATAAVARSAVMAAVT